MAVRKVRYVVLKVPRRAGQDLRLHKQTPRGANKIDMPGGGVGRHPGTLRYPVMGCESA